MLSELLRILQCLLYIVEQNVKGFFLILNGGNFVDSISKFGLIFISEFDYAD